MKMVPSVELCKIVVVMWVEVMAGDGGGDVISYISKCVLKKIIFFLDLNPAQYIATGKCTFGWAIENVVGLQVLNLSIKL